MPHSWQKPRSVLVIHFLDHPILSGQLAELVSYETRESAYKARTLYCPSQPSFVHRTSTELYTERGTCCTVIWYIFKVWVNILPLFLFLLHTHGTLIWLIAALAHVPSPQYSRSHACLLSRIVIPSFLQIVLPHSHKHFICNLAARRYPYMY